MICSLQASVSMKRIGDFLQNKDLGYDNVFQYPHTQETGNFSVDFVKFCNVVVTLSFDNEKEIMLCSFDARCSHSRVII